MTDSERRSDNGDTHTHRVIAGGLIGIVLLSVAGQIALAWLHGTADPLLGQLSAAGLGALVVSMGRLLDRRQGG